MERKTKSERTGQNLYIREHGQKTFVMISRFWLLRGWGRGRGGGRVNPLKKKICDKNLFYI